MNETIYYKGYGIDYYVTYPDLITVQYCGDDVIFQTIDEAKAFIDEVG